MSAALSLDCLTLPDTAPLEFIRIAAETGYRSVSLWVQPPALYEPMLAMPATARELADALMSTGVTIGNLEVFNLNSDEPVSGFAPALAFGAELGARTGTAIDFGDARPDMAERLAAFHALCARFGLATLVEPISMGATRTLEEGAALIVEAGVEAALVVDCVHLFRTGGSPAAIADLPAGMIGHVQLCDGPATLPSERIGEEAMAERLYPGEGAFPLRELLRALPPHTSLGIEAPSLSRQRAGLSPARRAREALDATRAMIGSVEAAA